MWKDSIKTGLALSDGNVWSRAARRKVMRGDDQVEQDIEFTFGVKVVVGTISDGSKLTIRWMKGHDSVVFESFCGMLVKKLINP